MSAYVSALKSAINCCQPSQVRATDHLTHIHNKTDYYPTARSVPPWEANSYGLMSLWDIVQPFDVVQLIFLLSQMCKYEAHADFVAKLYSISEAEDRKGFPQLPDESKFVITSIALLLAGFCRKYGLVESDAFAARLREEWFPAKLKASIDSQLDRERLNEPPVPPPSWSALSELGFPDITQHEVRFRLKDLLALIESEMKKQLFFHIPEAVGKFYKKERPMGDAVYDAFGRSRFDVTEAGTCLACGCNVASAFHLMRAAEVALWELGRDRQIPLAKSGKIEFAEWGLIIRELEDALKAIQQWPNSHKKEEAHKFYNSAVFEIRAFNDGWRRHAAHVRPQPAMEVDEALALWGHVSRFLEILATKISEGNYTPLVW